MSVEGALKGLRIIDLSTIAAAPSCSLTVAEDLLGKSVLVGAALAVEEMLDHPHIRHREMVLEEGSYRGLGFPIKLSRTPGFRRCWGPTAWR